MTDTQTDKHLFNGFFPGQTKISWHQKGKQQKGK